MAFLPKEGFGEVFDKLARKAASKTLPSPESSGQQVPKVSGKTITVEQIPETKLLSSIGAAPRGVGTTIFPVSMDEIKSAADTALTQGRESGRIPKPVNFNLRALFGGQQSRSDETTDLQGPVKPSGTGRLTGDLSYNGKQSTESGKNEQPKGTDFLGSLGNLLWNDRTPEQRMLLLGLTGRAIAGARDTAAGSTGGAGPEVQGFNTALSGTFAGMNERRGELEKQKLEQDKLKSAERIAAAKPKDDGDVTLRKNLATLKGFMDADITFTDTAKQASFLAANGISPEQQKRMTNQEKTRTILLLKNPGLAKIYDEASAAGLTGGSTSTASQPVQWEIVYGPDGQRIGKKRKA